MMQSELFTIKKILPDILHIVNQFSSAFSADGSALERQGIEPHVRRG
jgi:hypothetical protein